MTDAHRYDRVPAALPDVLPPISREAAAKLASIIMLKFWPWSRPRRGYIFPERNVRRVWISPNPTRASNHDKGIGRLIHDLSHDVFSEVYPRKRPHDPLHARYESDIAAYVADSTLFGLLLNPPAPPAPKPKPTAVELRALKYERTIASIRRWEAKARRAETALRKLRARQRGLLRAQTKAMEAQS